MDGSRPAIRSALPLPRAALRSKTTLIGMHAVRAPAPPRRAPSISDTLAGMPPPPSRAPLPPPRPRFTVTRIPAPERAVTLPSATHASRVESRFDWRAALLIATVLFGTGALAAVAFHHALRVRPLAPEAATGALTQSLPVVRPPAPTIATASEVAALVRAAPARMPIDREVAAEAVRVLTRAEAEGCGVSSRPAHAVFVVTFAPSGRATGAAVASAFGRTAPGRCLARALLGARIPEFVGAPTPVAVTVQLR